MDSNLFIPADAEGSYSVAGCGKGVRKKKKHIKDYSFLKSPMRSTPFTAGLIMPNG